MEHQLSDAGEGAIPVRAGLLLASVRVASRRVVSCRGALAAAGRLPCNVRRVASYDHSQERQHESGKRVRRGRAGRELWAGRRGRGRRARSAPRGGSGGTDDAR